jgi:hypothetical protein
MPVFNLLGISGARWQSKSRFLVREINSKVDFTHHQAQKIPPCCVHAG